MEYFSVEFVLPDNKLSYLDISSMSVRATSGAMEIMANHERSAMSLLTGPVVLKGKDGVVIIIASGAILSMDGKLCTVIARSAAVLGDVNKEKLLNLKGEIASVDIKDALLVKGLAQADLEFIEMVLQE